MAYDEKLARRLHELIAERRDFHEQKMFGGMGFLLRGNMCFGVWKDHLILRLGESQAQHAFKNKNVKPFDITGRALKGWVMVAPAGMKSKATLQQWVILAIDFVSQLPRK
jgi:TfoX/Sxy family transcriptional regulator of competence genes